MKSIMIIDDEKDLLEEIRTCLKDDDFQVITANNSREAIELMEHEREEDFGLILINTSMPNSKAPALFSMKPKNRKDIDTSNEADFLQKPFTKEQFLTFVKSRMNTDE